MSYDIQLIHPVSREVLQMDEPKIIKGGTYAVGGTKNMAVNITYNYSKCFRQHIDSKRGIRAIYGMTGAESIPVLKKAIDKLFEYESEDYWEPTEGNARVALIELMKLAEMRPDGVWNGD